MDINLVVNHESISQDAENIVGVEDNRLAAPDVSVEHTLDNVEKKTEETNAPVPEPVENINSVNAAEVLQKEFFLVFNTFKDFDRSFKEYQKNTLTSFCTSHNAKNFSKEVTLEEILQDRAKETVSGLPSIRWECQTGGLVVPFLGFPFISVGHSKYDCSQGRDLNVAEKMRWRKDRENKSKLGVYTPTRQLSRPTKKMGCPASMCCKKIYAFPSYKIPKDTKRKRTEVSKKLRDVFEKILKNNKINETENKEEKDSLGSLMYLTIFADPKSHKFHIEFKDETTPDILTPANTPLISLGSSYSKIKDLEDALASYKKQHRCKLYNAVNETIRLPSSPLLYEQLIYKCLYAVKDKGKNG